MKLLWPCVAFMTCLLGGAFLLEADELDTVLVQNASKIVRQLDDAGAKSVAVLRFGRQSNAGPIEYRGAMINSNLSNRLDNALVLAKGTSGLDILYDAMLEAEVKESDFSNTSKDRERLFELAYPLLFGEGRKKADVLLTGHVALDEADIRSAKLVVIGYFRNAPNKAETIAEIELETDRSVLTDLGISMTVSRANKPLPDFRSEQELLAMVSDDELGPGECTRTAFQRLSRGGQIVLQWRTTELGSRSFQGSTELRGHRPNKGTKR